MNIALIKAPSIANETRGVGVYTAELFSALKNHNSRTIELLDLEQYKATQKKYDLFHFTYFDPFFLTLPFINRTKTIVTVHDLTPIVLASGFPKGIRGEIKWQIQKKLLSRMDGIITVSNCSKNDIIKFTGFPEEKIAVIYEAASEKYRVISNQTLLENFRKKYSLPKKFILYIGDINYNKNIINLLHAFKKVAMKLKDVNLILVGKSFLGNITEAVSIRKEINELSLNKQIIMPGFVTQEDIISFYNLSSLYVQPSIYEGFGLPVLEAMSCGSLVVCGNNSSLSEISGNAATFTDVENPGDFAQAIINVMTLSSDKKNELRRRGLQQAQKFSWNKAAAQTYAVYEKIISK